MKKEESLLFNIATSYFKDFNFEYDIDINNFDWEYFYIITNEHKLLPIVCKILKKICPGEQSLKFKEKFNKFELQTLEYIDELVNLNRLAKENNIQYILIKGIALSKRVYGSLFDRSFHDLDIVVRENDMDKLYNLLYETGYRFLASFDEYALPRITEMKKFDSPIFVYSYNFHEYLVTKEYDDKMFDIEIKRGSSAISDSSKYSKMIDNAVPINITDILTVDTLDLEDDFIQLCANCYGNNELSWNNKYCLRDWIDIYGYISKYGMCLNWNKIIERSIEFNVLNRIYWALKSLEEIFGEPCLVSLTKCGIWNDGFANFHGFLDSMPVLNNGGIYQWTSSIKERIFDTTSRIQQKTKHRLATIYNAKSKNIVAVNTDTFERFIDTNYGFSFDYKFDTYDSNIILNIRMDELNYIKLNSIRILFDFYSNNLDLPAFECRVITFTLCDGLLQISTTYEELNGNIVKEEYLNYLITLVLPLESLDYNPKNINIAYNIRTTEKLLKNYVLRLSGVLFTNLSDSVGFIAIK